VSILTVGKGVKFLKDKQPNKSLQHAVSFLSQIGVTMISCVFVGVFLGRFLDSRLKTTPWLLLVFSLLGVGAALKSFFDLANGK
jgi:ATP synthase protein I